METLLSLGAFLFVRPYPEELSEKKTWHESQFYKGLWSKRENKLLYILKNPKASSLFKIHPKLNEFITVSQHEIVDTKQIGLESMQNVLQDVPSPDFIKVDAEGSDLEILKGAEIFLAKNVLGVQVEVPFISRHVNAPFFADIDSYLRQFSFELFDLTLERWQRKNGFSNFETKSQIVWGNVLYLLSKEVLLQRLDKLSTVDREEKIKKYFLILLAYKVHDYIEELRLEFESKGWIDSEFSKKLKEILIVSFPKFYKIRILLASFLASTLSIVPINSWKKMIKNYQRRIWLSNSHFFFLKAHKN